MRRALTVALSTVAVALSAAPASASLVFRADLDVQAQGFGNAPRDLTIQAQGNRTTESGCVGVSAGGGITFGGSACGGGDAGFHPNGVISTGGNESNPLADNQKHGIPTVQELGWASAADVGVLFNAVESAGGGVNLTDLTLKFYSQTGTLLGSIDGNCDFPETLTGNGNAGFLFTVSADEQAYVNNLLANGAFYTALNATVTGVSGGAESFAIVNINPGMAGPVPEPGTWAMMLFGFGGIGFAMRRSRKSATRTLLQAA